MNKPKERCEEINKKGFDISKLNFRLKEKLIITKKNYFILK